MAESDDANLFGVSRRALISGIAAVPSVIVNAGGASDPNPSGDPILPLWHEWRAAHRAEVACCHEWQRIEKLLAQTVGFRSEREACWEAAAEAAGLDDADARQTAACEMKEEISAAMFAQPSGTLIGIAAKLVVILATGEPRRNDPEFPWPQIRSALIDLRRLGGISESMLAL